MSLTPESQPPQRILAIKVHQWLEEWEKVMYDPNQHRAKPQPFFYLFSLKAATLRALSGIERRSTTQRLEYKEDLGIQRRHEPERSAEIRRFVEYGYPWSELSENKRQSGEFDELRKPGWLPTAVVVNILGPSDSRRGYAVAKEDLILVGEETDQTAAITLPLSAQNDEWRPTALPPVEVIDGQHRLWAFDQDEPSGRYEIPVVAFLSLDISWQAYQFWTINIKPKRINKSLAYDLYPLLRAEEWLDKFEGHLVYREIRAQELVQHLWSHPESPWYQRINMLGEKGNSEMATQASWIRSLMSTFVRAPDSPRIGGLFGASKEHAEQILPWSRTQQAALLILVGNSLKDAVKRQTHPWAEAVRNAEPQSAFAAADPAFESKYSLLTGDIGIRGLLFIANDLCFLNTKQLGLEDWILRDVFESDQDAIRYAVESLSTLRTGDFIRALSTRLAEFDWRTSAAPGLSADEQTTKKTLRGSGGYREIRRLLLHHLASGDDQIARTSAEAIGLLGY